MLTQVIMFKVGWRHKEFFGYCGGKVWEQSPAKRGNNPIANGRSILFPILFSQQIWYGAKDVKAVTTNWSKARIRRSRSVEL